MNEIWATSKQTYKATVAIFPGSIRSFKTRLSNPVVFSTLHIGVMRSYSLGSMVAPPDGQVATAESLV